MCRTVYHPPCATGRTETPAFAAEGNKFLVMAVITANSQEAMFQTATLQVVIELSDHKSWQLLALCRQHCLEFRPVALDQLI
jgi:hypothetical protein